MSLFWLALLLLVALPFLPIYQVTKYQHENDEPLLELNRQVFQQRLSELETQQVAGDIDLHQFEDMKLELQLNLISDMEGLEAIASKPDKMWPAVVITGLALLMVLVLYFTSGRFEQYQQWQANAARLPELKAMLNNPEQQMTTGELNKLALALRTRLYEQPDNALDWLLLGQITSYLGQVEQGLKAFSRAIKLEPENVDIQSFYGMALASTGDPDDAKRAYVILKELVEKNPEDLALANGIAFAFVEMGRKVEAAMIWTDMAMSLPEDNPRRASILKIVDQLVGNASTNHSGVTMAHDAQTEATEYSLPVTISIDNTLKARLPSEGFLFIYAQAANGPETPLAIKRLALPAFPLAVTLSEADAMMDGWNLTSVDSFTLVARVSVASQGDAKPGDLQGRSGVLQKSQIDGGIGLIISHVVGD